MVKAKQSQQNDKFNVMKETNRQTKPTFNLEFIHRKITYQNLAVNKLVFHHWKCKGICHQGVLH